jgi:hypothetical protein
MTPGDRSQRCTLLMFALTLALLSSVRTERACWASPERPVYLYVSTTGSDQWSGTRAERASEKDGPFRSIARAQREVRELKGRAAKERPTIVYVRGGYYELPEPLVFSTADGGLPNAEIAYTAFPGEHPIISGGVRLHGWRRPDQTVPGTPEAAHGHLWVTPVQKGWRFNDLFVNGLSLQRASVPITGNWRTWPKAVALAGNVIRLPNQQWAEALSSGDPEVDALPQFKTRFANALLSVKSIAPESLAVAVKGADNLKPGDILPFRVENTLRGLTQPGTWLVDSQKGLVICWPPAGVDLSQSDVIAPRLRSAIVVIGREEPGGLVRYLRFSGLGVAYTDRGPGGDRSAPLGYSYPYDIRDSAVFLSGVQNLAFINARVFNVGGMGIRALHYVQQVSIRNTIVTHCGGSGISFEGYPPGTHDANRDNDISGNHISDCGRATWHAAAISLSMAGNSTIEGNQVSHQPFDGISVTGLGLSYFVISKGRPSQEHYIRWSEVGDEPLTPASIKKFIPGNVLIENNLVHDVMRRLEDGGGIHVWATHNVLIRGNRVFGTSDNLSYGIYLDGETSDSTVECNLVYHTPAPDSAAGSALYMNQNGSNRAVNNVFALSPRLFWFRLSLGDDLISRNIFLFGRRCVFGDPSGPAAVSARGLGASVMDRNIYWSVGGSDCPREVLKKWQASGWDKHSLLADPGFRDPVAIKSGVIGNASTASIGFRPFTVPPP